MAYIIISNLERSKWNISTIFQILIKNDCLFTCFHEFYEQNYFPMLKNDCGQQGQRKGMQPKQVFRAPHHIMKALNMYFIEN